jgi:hypothetical protein
MPLPSHAPREEMHLRDIQMRGYRRLDGLFDIEGRLTDRKTEPLAIRGGPTVPAFDLIHDMTVRLTIDADYNVCEAIASSDATPYDACPAAAASLRHVVGLNVSAGWGRELRARLGGTKGCTHLLEILVSLGTVAFQTLVPFRRDKPVPADANGRPRQIDSCLAYAGDGQVVALVWPEHYTGPRKKTT